MLREFVQRGIGACGDGLATVGGWARGRAGGGDEGGGEWVGMEKRYQNHKCVRM